MSQFWNVRKVATAVGVATALAGLAPQVLAALSRNVAPVANPQYAKECGACHMPFPPELLPARSWQAVMGSLQDHFGETAQLDEGARARIADYLTSNSADRAQNSQSMNVMQSLRAGDAPRRITQVPYIAGLHAAVLDPVWGGDPHPKTLAECGVCHYKADGGDFFERRFKVTDEQFRGK